MIIQWNVYDCIDRGPIREEGEVVRSFLPGGPHPRLVSNVCVVFEGHSRTLTAFV